MRGEEVNSTEISDDNRDHDDDGHEPDHGDDVDDDGDDGWQPQPASHHSRWLRPLDRAWEKAKLPSFQLLCCKEQKHIEMPWR